MDKNKSFLLLNSKIKRKLIYDIEIIFFYGEFEVHYTNKIRINHECYLKHTMTNLNDANEPFTVSTNTLEMQ